MPGKHGPPAHPHSRTPGVSVRCSSEVLRGAAPGRGRAYPTRRIAARFRHTWAVRTIVAFDDGTSLGLNTGCRAKRPKNLTGLPGHAALLRLPVATPQVVCHDPSTTRCAAGLLSSLGHSDPERSRGGIDYLCLCGGVALETRQFVGRRPVPRSSTPMRASPARTEGVGTAVHGRRARPRCQSPRSARKARNPRTLWVSAFDVSVRRNGKVRPAAP